MVMSGNVLINVETTNWDSNDLDGCGKVCQPQTTQDRASAVASRNQTWQWNPTLFNGGCFKYQRDYIIYIWLVVSTPLKIFVSWLGLLFPIYGKIKSVPNHQPVYR